MGRNAIQQAKSFSWDNYGRKIEECLNDNGRCVFFNMMNKREINLKRINDASDLIRNKAFYYMDFLVHEK